MESQLKRPLDLTTKALIRAEIEDNFDRLLFERENNFFSFESIIESIDAYGIISTQGWYQIQEGGVLISVRPVTNREPELRKTLEFSGRLFSFESRSRARWTVYITYGDFSATTFANGIAYILHGDRDADIGYYGFKLSGADWKGVAKRSGVAEVLTPVIQTYVNDVTHDLEAHYDPRSGILFRVDAEDRGRINITDVGKLGNAQPNLLDIYIQKTNTPKNISSTTDATPIVVTTSAAHGFDTGDYVVIENHTVNVAANNSNSNPYWVITKLTDTTFSLDGSVGSGAGAGGADGVTDFARLFQLVWYDFKQVLIADFS